jgi:hypothetical protein
MGAATFAITGHDVHGKHRVVKGTLTFSDSYTTGGDSLAAKADVGVGEIQGFLVEGNDTGVSVDIDVTDPTAPTFVLYTSDETEAGSTSDNSGVEIPVWLLGSS